MKNTFFGIVLLSVLWFSSCGSSASPDKNPTKETAATGSSRQTETAGSAVAESSESVIQLTNAMFLEKVYDYNKDPKKWTFKGDKPCIIDFYADWCRPCKMVAPIMAELSDKYKGEIVIYKVNTDQEPELSQFFGIRSIPTVFFCPSSGDPQMTQGALPKETYEKVITDFLLKKK